jgi:hypothetical protein
VKKHGKVFFHIYIYIYIYSTLYSQEDIEYILYQFAYNLNLIQLNFNPIVELELNLDIIKLNLNILNGFNFI